MEDKLRAHMEHLFRDVPPTKKAVELKEEILQNLVDKYHDLIQEGKSEEAAYNIAVASIGDISELLESLKDTSSAKANAYMDEEYRAWKKRSSILIPTAVLLYICSVIPPIIASELRWMNDSVGPCFMFVFIGIATAIIVFNNMSKPTVSKVDGTIMEEFKEWKASQDDKKKVRKSINSALWTLILVLYFLISFSTGAWHITWVIFLVGAAAESIIKAIFELKG